MNTKQADANLDPSQYGVLNSEFYSAEPAAYFRSRTRLLFLAGGAAQQLDKLLVEGVSYEGLVVKLEAKDQDESDEQQLRSFLITESEVLLHHASEVLLRLYLAHRQVPDCPWLEILRLQGGPEFRRQIDDLVDIIRTPDHRTAVAQVFLARTPDDVEAQEAIEAISHLLLILAQRLSSRANMYNSMKHGLTIVAGQSSLMMTVEGSDRPAFGSAGPSVAFLEVKGDRAGRPRWYRTTSWISIKRNLWLLELVVTELDSLWRVAKARYTGVVPDGVQVITKESIEAYNGELARGGSTASRASFTLAYLEPKRSTTP